MKRHHWFLMALLILAWWPSCALAAEGKAVLQGTQPNSPIFGTVTLTPATEGLHIEVSVKNVPPGRHGLHFHEHGSCAEAGNAAGGHYNPDHVKHGFLPADGFGGAHAGDLGNIEVAADGTGVLALTISGLTLDEGPHGVAGRSVILHEKADDFGQPTGNAGGRIGCGVITVGG